MFFANPLRTAVLAFCLTLSTLFTLQAHADDKVLAKEVSDASDTAANADTPLPDLFTGTMSYRIPIEVPVGRKGVDPGIVLTYRSTNGNGWLGAGWELELGSIERSTKKGVNYSGNEFIMRGPGGVSELVEVTASGGSFREYRAKIEGAFTKYKYYGTYWEAINKRGIVFRFGSDTSTKQGLDGNNTFKWCLDRITDTNGNYASLSYIIDNGQIYPSTIDYTSNDSITPSLSATTRVRFNLEDRADAPTVYTTNFAVKTAKRLKNIGIRSNISADTPSGVLVRRYVLN